MTDPTCCDLSLYPEPSDDYAGKEEPDCGDCNDAGLPGCLGCDPDAPRTAPVGPFPEEPAF